MRARAADRKLIVEDPPVDYTKFEAKRFDWSRTNLFKRCLKNKRFSRMQIDLSKDYEMMRKVNLLKAHPNQFDSAHILMPIVEDALDHLEDMLCNELSMWAIYQKIKRQQKVVDYTCTL